MEVRGYGQALAATAVTLLLYSFSFSSSSEPVNARCNGETECGSAPYLNSKKIAVLVASAPHILLLPAVDNAVAHLPWDWRIALFLPDDVANEALTKPMLRELVQDGKIIMTPNEWDSQAKSLLNRTFWDRLGDVDRVLTFGPGTSMCMSARATPDSFAMYDYVDSACGSPSSNSSTANHTSSGTPIPTDPAHVSRIILFSKTKALEALSESSNTSKDPSSFFCDAFTALGSNVAPVLVAAELAVGPSLHVAPFGVDSAHRSLVAMSDMISELYENCPEVVLLADWGLEAQICSSGEMPALNYIDLNGFCSS